MFAWNRNLNDKSLAQRKRENTSKRFCLSWDLSFKPAICFFYWFWKVADLKGLRTFTTDILHYLPIFVGDPLLLRVTSYQGVKDLKKRLSDNLGRRTDDRRHGGLWKLHCRNPSWQQIQKLFFQDREKRGCFHMLATLLTTLTCALVSLFILKLCKFGDYPLNLQAFKNPW